MFAIPACQYFLTSRCSTLGNRKESCGWVRSLSASNKEFFYPGETAHLVAELGDQCLYGELQHRQQQVLCTHVWTAWLDNTQVLASEQEKAKGLAQKQLRQLLKVTDVSCSVSRICFVKHRKIIQTTIRQICGPIIAVNHETQHWHVHGIHIGCSST